MLEMVQGCAVPRPELLSEQYQAGENGMMANVNASKIQQLFAGFIAMHNQPMLLILELPASAQQERQLRKSDQDPMHKDVYYIDGLDQAQSQSLLEQYGPLLIQDGISSFGFGLHDGGAELFQEKYNILRLWFQNPEPYREFFSSHGIPRVERCFTAWDTFSLQSPGHCFRVELEGRTVLDLPALLTDWGIYLAEQRED